MCRSKNCYTIYRTEKLLRHILLFLCEWAAEPETNIMSLTNGRYVKILCLSVVNNTLVEQQKISSAKKIDFMKEKKENNA